MADNNGGAAGAAGSGSGETTFTQEQVNAMISKRVNEEKAKYADYDTLKEKAGKYDQQQNEGKTELQKATERADALQAQIDKLTKDNEVKTVREKVAAETKVPVELLTCDTEEDCKKQAEAIMKFAKPNGYPGTRKGGTSNNGSGGAGSSSDDDYRELARNLFG
ncbi:MAG: hypothetical protein MJ117_00340 [Lachnospiraceae bacterium]|nr:hypothetical protein [Lachnospiraceae bacterium]